MTLTPFDDYPIHQTPLVVAESGGGHPNFYDRYWFNGFDADEGLYVGVAMGLYPNRRVIDAAFSVVLDGEQRSVFASSRAPLDRRHTEVGPVRIEIVEPLSTNRVVVDPGDRGLGADLVWRPRTAAIAEPRHTMMDGHTPMLDATRLVQWGTWEGTVTFEGRTLDISAERVRGTKDRSWGLRPVGDPAPAAPGDRPPGIFFLWGPVHFADRCSHVILFDRPDGSREYDSAFAVPVIADGGATWGPGVHVLHANGVAYELDYRPGTRRARRARFTVAYPDRTEELVYEPLFDFQMAGLGYLHPRYRHGMWHGGDVVATDGWTVSELAPLELHNLHVQQVCRVTGHAGERGVGVLENVAIGPHAPTGLRDYFDGAPEA